MATQSCPNCQRAHDVAVYVTGQRILCSCGTKFEVRRSDVPSSNKTLNVRSGRSTDPAVLRTVIAGPPREQAGAEPELEVTFRPPSRSQAQNGIPVSVSPEPMNALAPHAVAGPGVSAPASAPVAVPGVGGAAPSSQTYLALPRIEIPGFELLELLGRGGMGEVWRAHQKSLGRTVAVKLLPEELARDSEFVARFEKEATALAALSHPHIIQIIDRGVSQSHYYFVMEYVDGRSLREVITSHRPTPQEALRLVLQILRAMEAAHEKNIIHRDLKPENILVDGRGHVKVADFGLAGMRGGEERLQLTATAVAMGTLNYMAPEQRRDARNVDQRADLYAVGVILYELLTGDLPVGRFRLPSEVSGVDARLDAVVNKLLETDPLRRYATASEVIAALEPLQTSPAVLAPGSSPSQPNAAATPSGAPARPSSRSIVEKGFRSVRTGLMVIGALAVVAVGSRLLFGRSAAQVTIQSGDKKITIGAPDSKGTAKLPYTQNSEAEFFSDVTESKGPDGRTSLAISFDGGDEEINVHSGEWKLENGALTAVQAGNLTEDGDKLVPRAYLAKRYFSADDFDVEVEVTYKDIRDRYEVGADVQRFAEVAFRIKDLQVSAFAIPGVGMRLGWRYFTPDGLEVTGNSARDLELMVEDEMPAPQDGVPFRLRVAMKRVKDAVQVTAFLNGHPFAKKILPGLQGQIGKVALGCRNYECQFRELRVSGTAMAKPAKKAAGVAE